MPSDSVRPAPRSVSALLCALAACVFCWTALLTYSAGDWPSPDRYPNHYPPHNACGTVGAFTAYYLKYAIGDGAFPLLLFASLATVLSLVRGAMGRLYERAFGLALLIVAIASASHLLTAGGSADMMVGNGGLVGHAVGHLLAVHVSTTGTIIILAAAIIVGLLFATDGWVLRLPGMTRRVGASSMQSARRLAGETRRWLPRPALAVARPGTRSAGVSAAESAALLGTADESPASRKRKRKPPTEPGDNLFDQPEPSEEVESEENEPTDADMVSNELEDVEEAGDIQDETTVDEDRAERRRKAAKALSGPKVNFPTPQKLARAEPYPKQIENWVLPSLELLAAPEYGFGSQQEIVVREQAKVLEATLAEFRVDASVVEIDTGPVITMFELRLGAGIKVSQIAALANDIARALKAHAIRVVAPISGKNTIGIEVPNTQKEQVRLKELITMAGKKASEMNLPLFLGKDAGGAALVADLTKMPHLLIAGTTGSGKSVCLNSVVLSLLMTKRPDHVKLIMVDPKMVEMSQFKEVPHLMCPIVTDMARAEKILEWAVTKMEERYEILAEARVRDIASYNRLTPEELYDRFEPQTPEEKARISTHLPFIVIIIDELADLMMTSAKEVEHHLSRLAQKSRAVGIHIIVATQRPEARVVTGLIKSNLPCRICFRVASRMDSRIVLDQNGGEVLLGQGDMLFLPPGTHKLTRAQGTFLNDREVQAVLDDLASRAKPEFHPELVRIKNPGEDNDLALRDPLFDDAVRIVIDSQRGSVSLLQRRLTIGYSRASRLIDQMAEAGIVGTYKGSQAREVCMTMEEWDALKEQLDADLQAGYAADRDDDTDHSDDDDAVPALTDDHDIRG